MHTLMRGVRVIGYLLWGICGLTISIFLSWYFGGELRGQFYKWGLVLHVIGMMSVTIELIGPPRLKNYAEMWRDNLSQIIIALNNQDMGTWGRSPKIYAWANLLKIFLFSSLHLLIYAFSRVFQIDVWLFLLLFGALILLLHLWVWSFIANTVLLLTNSRPPKFLAKLFHWTDYGISNFVVLILLAIFLPVLDGIDELSNLSIRTMIAWITFPLIFAGTLFQLVAALL